MTVDPIVYDGVRLKGPFGTSSTQIKTAIINGSTRTHEKLKDWEIYFDLKPVRKIKSSGAPQINVL